MIGRILTALRENDLADNTLVVYSSDHGELVGEHDLWMKRTFYEESAKVPAIVSWPGVLPTGDTMRSSNERLRSQRHHAPSFGCSRPYPIRQGGRHWSCCARDSGDWEDVAFSEYALREGQVQRMVRRGPWKLVYHWRERPQLFNLEEDSSRASGPGRRAQNAKRW